MSGIIKLVNPLEIKIPPPQKSFLIKSKFIPRGCIRLAGDKSIAHRALILSALSDNNTRLKNFPVHDDSLATLNTLRVLGVKILFKKGLIYVFGRGFQGLNPPEQPLQVGNSGTTLRLILGVLAGLPFKVKVIAGKYLSARPMSRVNIPLRLMGARIIARKKAKEEFAPLVIRGGDLKGIVYHLKIASAQVKSAILLAGLLAKGRTQVCERLSTRDHTERMLKTFGVNISIRNKRIILKPGLPLSSPGEIYIPGDISSAAFFIVLALIIPQASITIEQTSLNPSRMGLIKVLKRMGAKINLSSLQSAQPVSFEPCGDLKVISSKLKGTVVNSREIPYLVDELPILMVAACFAQGLTVIKGVSELRVKETDRINSMVFNLQRMGADIRVKRELEAENIIIYGGRSLHAAKLKSFGDHRTAMSMVVAAMAVGGQSILDDISCVNKSFPDFLKKLNSLNQK